MDTQKHKIVLSYCCQKGLIRNENQDNYYIDTKNNRYAVFDGMGGHSDGAKASDLAVEYCEKNPRTYANVIIKEIDKYIASHEKEEEAYLNQKNVMGTTGVIVDLDLKERFSTIVWAGDSRCYIVKDNKLIFNTTDHNVLEEKISSGEWLDRDVAQFDREAHLLTAFLGSSAISENYFNFSEEYVLLDKGFYRIMVCSDGVYNHCNEKEILNYLSKSKNWNPNDIVADIEEIVLSRGASDNFTMIVLQFEIT